MIYCKGLLSLFLFLFLSLSLNPLLLLLLLLALTNAFANIIVGLGYRRLSLSAPPLNSSYCTRWPSDPPSKESSILNHTHFISHLLLYSTHPPLPPFFLPSFPPTITPFSPSLTSCVEGTDLFVERLLQALQSHSIRHPVHQGPRHNHFQRRVAYLREGGREGGREGWVGG